MPTQMTVADVIRARFEAIDRTGGFGDYRERVVRILAEIDTVDARLEQGRIRLHDPESMVRQFTLPEVPGQNPATSFTARMTEGQLIKENLFAFLGKVEKEAKKIETGGHAQQVAIRDGLDSLDYSLKEVNRILDDRSLTNVARLDGLKRELIDGLEAGYGNASFFQDLRSPKSPLGNAIRRDGTAIEIADSLFARLGKISGGLKALGPIANIVATAEGALGYKANAEEAEAKLIFHGSVTNLRL